MSDLPSTTSRLRRAVVVGAAAGVVASLVMAAYAMGASLAKDTGLLTPLYHIASLLAPQDAMMASMEGGMAGDAVHVEAGPAVLGVVIHLATGAAYGVLFALAVARLRLGTAVLAGLGVLWGLVVFAVSAFVGLPAAAAIFGSGDQIADMAEMAGWGTFLVEHLLYGLVLGLLVAARSRDRSREPAAIR